MGAPLGNNNAGNGKLFRAAMEKAVAKKSNSQTDKFKILVDMCETALDKAVAGDLTAFKEIRDTLDGKPAQAVNLGDHEGNALTIKLVHYGDK